MNWNPASVSDQGVPSSLALPTTLWEKRMQARASESAEIFSRGYVSMETEYQSGPVSGDRERSESNPVTTFFEPNSAARRAVDCRSSKVSSTIPAGD